MKKVFALTLAAGMFAVTSCGPSAEEIAAKEKQTNDSLAAIATADSIAKAYAEKAMADSIALVEMTMKAKADSTRMADSLAALKKGAPKKPKPVVSAPKEGEGKPGDIKKGMKKPGAAK